MISVKYIQRYLWLNQLAYAILAFPIGTVLSLAALYLHEQKHVPLHLIGWAMAAGEAIGIATMKMAEASKTGFVFRRPHDLHFIAFCMAFFLMMIPVGPESMWYLSCLAVLSVQTFNSASKPVVGESLHRLSFLAEIDPTKEFAQANTMRRIGNAVIGIATPLMYTVHPIVPFLFVGGMVLSFLGLLLWSFNKIQTKFESFVDNEEADTGHVQSSSEEDDYVHNSSDKENSIVTVLRSFKQLETDEHIDSEQAEYEEGESQSDTVGAVDVSALSYFLTVDAYPMLDAAITRLPFTFLTVAIADQSGVFIASVVLLSYQTSKAIAQFIQSWRCTPQVGYVLNSCALCAYVALVAYIEVFPSGHMWFIPFAFAGLAETLPVQQYYLIRMYGCTDGENTNVRRAVKRSHTGTGVGAMAAFLIASQIYDRFDVYGVAYLGLGIQLVKVLVNVIIDLAGLLEKQKSS